MMKLAFMGSPAFAVPTLRGLVSAGHAIVAVYCQPPRPAGRGQSLRRCAVHEEADRLGLPVFTPGRLRKDQKVHEEFSALGLDAAIVAAYGLLLPDEMLVAPRRGCLNVHASLLPRWRGAAPIQAAIMAGDAETGITIMKMDAGLDTGDILLQASMPITEASTATALHDGLAIMGADLILSVLTKPPTPRRQPSEGATYAPKLTRKDGEIDWTNSADHIDRQIRALNPWPGTFTQVNGIDLKVLEGFPLAGSGPPGTVLDEALVVACGTGALRLTKLQWPSRSALPTDQFLRGHALPVGTRLGN